MPYKITYATLIALLTATSLQAQITNSITTDSLRNQTLLNPSAAQGSQTLSATRYAVNTHTAPPKQGIALLPITWLQQYNTSMPYGWNDGPMIPTKGYQTYLSGGIKANYKRWQLRLQPEMVHAANQKAEGFPATEIQSVREIYVNYLNSTDIPEQFGSGAYTKIYWGQSSLKYQAKKWEAGISTQNLWWGPGTRNALLMSNNAPGFLHLSFNTHQPVQTKIGNFEAQLIAGRLEGANLGEQAADFSVGANNAYLPKANDWRYLSGLSFNYQPKWIPGLYLGLNRVFQVYGKDLGNGITDYLPVITPFQKKNLSNEDAKKRDQLASLFMRWVFHEAKAEIYVEHGWNDHSSSFYDLLLSPDHSRAFILGMRKLFPLAKKDTYLSLHTEITHLQQTADRVVRPAGAWYHHWHVRHGYTHKGQVIGAGIGPGSNLQSIHISFWQPQKVWGIMVERYAHNLDFFYDAYADPNQVFSQYNRKWVDLNLNTYIRRSYKRFSLQASLNTSWMRNYQYQDQTKINAQLQTILSYKF